MTTDTKFKIEGGIPMPPVRHRGRRSKYPFADLEVGQSFFVPEVNGAKSLSGAMTAAAKRLGRKFVSRAFTEQDAKGNDVTGRRVWRVE